MAIGRVPGETGIQPSIVTAKGDLIVATASGSVTNQAVGTNNQVLMADSAQADGVKWANEATATLTTTGDTLYASAANTPARLGIGTTGQVLTVAGGVPSWATPAATGSSWSLIATSATMTGAQTITVSGISGKDKLLVLINNAGSASASSIIGMRINTDTGTNYDYNQVGASSGYSPVINTLTGETSFQLARMGNQVSSIVGGWAMITGGNGSGFKSITSSTMGSASAGGTGWNWQVNGGFWKGSGTITSISLISGTGNFDEGTFSVYGSDN